MIDRLTMEDFEAILGKSGMNLHGWFKRRMKRAIRLLTEGRIYDDPGADGARTPRQLKSKLPNRRKERIAALRERGVL